MYMSTDEVRNAFLKFFESALTITRVNTKVLVTLFNTIMSNTNTSSDLIVNISNMLKAYAPCLYFLFVITGFKRIILSKFTCRPIWLAYIKNIR